MKPQTYYMLVFITDSEAGLLYSGTATVNASLYKTVNHALSEFDGPVSLTMDELNSILDCNPMHNHRADNYYIFVTEEFAEALRRVKFDTMYAKLDNKGRREVVEVLEQAIRSHWLKDPIKRFKEDHDLTMPIVEQIKEIQKRLELSDDTIEHLAMDILKAHRPVSFNSALRILSLEEAEKILTFMQNIVNNSVTANI